jgi:single-strand DNA-binding protein
MNKVILMGRLTKDPNIRYSQGENNLAIARYTLAVDRRFKKESDQTADFISCVAFGKQAEFAEKYLKQGIKIAITGRIQTGSYTNKMALRYIQQILSWRNRNLQRVKEAVIHNQHRQIQMDL